MANFMRIADSLCLDYINTRIFERGLEVEHVQNFGDLLQFLLESSMITPAVAGDLGRNWPNTEQNRALRSALTFRDQLREMAESLSRNQPLDGTTLLEINELLAQQRGYTSVTKNGTAYELRKHRNIEQPEDLLLPLAESAASLLCEGDRTLVKKCGNPNCNLFFYDTTRNHTRRWCSMETCGNRMKVNSYLQRKRQTGNGL